MAEVLSQSEIDALLNAVSDGKVEGGAAEASGANPSASQPISTGPQRSSGNGDWVAYDLTSDEKVGRARLAGLQGIHDRFARAFRMTISKMLKKNVTVNATNIEYIKFGNYLSNILLPASLNIFSLPQFKGYMLLIASSKLTYAMVDTYYGGIERPFSKMGGKEQFTTIETNMVRKMCELALGDLKDAWSLIYPLELEYSRMESNPNFVGVIQAPESVAVVTFEIELENLSGPLILIIQLKALEPIQHLLTLNVTGEMKTDETLWQQHWQEEMSQVSVDIRVNVGETSKQLREISQWKAGDLLMLNQDASQPLTLYVEGLAKLEGMMGVCRGNNAVRVTQMIDEEKTIGG